MTGIPIGTVKARMVRGLTHLREMIEAEGAMTERDDIPVELRDVAARLQALGREEWEPAEPPPLRVAVPARRASPSALGRAADGSAPPSRPPWPSRSSSSAPQAARF